MEYKYILVFIAFVFVFVAISYVAHMFCELIRAIIELLEARAWYWHENTINEQLQQIVTKRELEANARDEKNEKWKDSE